MAGEAIRILLAEDDDAGGTGCGAVLEVEDSGIGIAPAGRELVFERFYRLLGSDPKGENLDGSGLGLAIVREIIHQHRAQVRISAPGHGSGCVFTVTFPPVALAVAGPVFAARAQQC